jgi:hypothetical protein
MATYAQCAAEYDNATPDDEYCEDCGMEKYVDCTCDEERSYCPDCKTIDGCSCDEQYQAYKERDL